MNNNTTARIGLPAFASVGVFSGQTRLFRTKIPSQVIPDGRSAKPEIAAQRLEICRRCEKRRMTPTGVEWCGICGCKAGGKEFRLDALAAHEENLPRWGCKHPQRKEGKGWPIDGNGNGDTGKKMDGKKIPEDIFLPPNVLAHQNLQGNRWQEDFHVKNIGGRNLFDQVRSPSLLFTADNEPVNLQNLYRGRSCFLICGGPSFAKLDHSKLRQPGILTMGVNNSAKTFRPNLWTCGDSPDHFIRSVWLDPAILKLAPVESRNAPIFNSDTWSYLDKTVGDCPNVFFFKRHLGFDAAKFLTADTCCWGNDDSRGGVRSVMLPALRLLHYLGVRRIFLLGCDFKMDARHAYHFNQRRGADSVRGNNTSYDILRRRFKQLRPVLESAGLRVFNCNPESKLDAFEKITFDRAAALCLEEWGNINLATERTAGLYDRPKPKPQPPRPTVTLPASFKPGLTVITCTRNRPEAFKLLERWMGRQTRKWDQWLAVNDGQQRYEYTLGQEVIARVPMQGEGHSLTANLLAALPRIRHEHIVFVEDDDWLGPKYLESMSAALKKGPLVGNVPALYYNVATGRWQDMRNRAHASLGQTAIHAKLLPLVAEIAGCGSPQIDLALWRKWSGKKKFIRSGGLHVGIKGMPGENGIGVGHHVDFGKADEKPNLGKLRSWIGEDANVYLRPKISVSVSAPTGQTACIITCHNYGRFLDQCIESCLSQSSPFESIVIVNDASTDDTDVVARRYIRRGVRYLHGHWRDFTLARRAGLEVSPRTPFLLFVDADNWLDRRYHELLRTAMNSSSIGATYGNLLNVNETGRKLGLNPNVGAFDRHVLRLRNFADACSLIRREAYDQVGGWPRNSYLTDWMLWLAMTRYGWTLRHVPEAILNYRLHGAQMSNVRFGNFDLCVEPLRKSCMVAIVTLFCGRQWALERYFRWIAALNWNRENLHVVALDNSASSAFSGKLTQALRDCGLAFSYVADPTHIVSGLSAATFASKREARSHHSYLLAAHMARLYAVARTHMPHGTDFIWTVEDDVEPPSDALHHLLLGLYRYPKAGVVTGCARSRFEDQWILRKGGHPLLSAPAPDTYEPVDATGFYCALFRFPVWDAIAFRPTRDWSLRNCAYDWAAMSDIIQSGWRVLAAGSVRCKHWQADGSFL